MRREDKPTWRQKLFAYLIFLKPLACIFPVLFTVGLFYYFHISKEEGYSTASPELRPIPAISLPDKAGKLHRLDELKEPGIVVFWASWCGPCVDELKQLERSSLGTWSYLAINSADKREAALRFLDNEKLQKPLVLFDDDGQIGGIRSYPTVYVSFANGFWAGPLRSWRFEDMLQEAKHTLAKTEFRPFQQSEESRQNFRRGAFGRFYYNAAYLLGPIYFLVLLFFLRKHVRRTGFLRFALFAYTLFYASETVDWRLAYLFRARGIAADLVGYIYYSPFLWGGLITLGIVIYLRQFLPEKSETVR